MPISVEMFRRECSAQLDLQLVAGARGIYREIAGSRVGEAALATPGEESPSPEGHVQVVGDAAMCGFLGQEPERQAESADRFFSGCLACAVIAGGRPAPEPLRDAAERHAVPLFGSRLSASSLVEEAERRLARLLAESTTVHGVLVDVIGVGVLLTGRSGIGKSECALDLVLRGHRFVADDVIHIEKLGPATLLGRGSDLTAHHMEIRGLGIINIRDIFGLTATAQRKKMELVIQIEEWNPSKEYDRLGLEDGTVEILGIPLPSLVIPVSPGRNLATIVEVAVRNHLLKQQGVHSARDLVERQTRRAGEAKAP